MEFELVELLANSSFPVKIILLLLVLSSLFSWIIIFEKYFTLDKSLKLSHQIEDRFWDGDNLENLVEEVKERDLEELETSELVLLTVYEELHLSEKGKANIKVEFSSPDSLYLNGAFFRIELPEEFGKETQFDFRTPSSLSSNDLSGNLDGLYNAPAEGLVVSVPSREFVIDFKHQTKVIIRKNSEGFYQLNFD